MESIDWWTAGQVPGGGVPGELQDAAHQPQHGAGAGPRLGPQSAAQLPRHLPPRPHRIPRRGGAGAVTSQAGSATTGTGFSDYFYWQLFDCL